MAKDHSLHLASVLLEIHQTLSQHYRNVPSIELVVLLDKKLSTPMRAFSHVDQAKLTVHLAKKPPQTALIHQVLGHEVAHLMAYKLKASKVHCWTWNSVVKTLGHEPLALYTATQSMCLPPKTLIPRPAEAS